MTHLTLQVVILLMYLVVLVGTDSSVIYCVTLTVFNSLFLSDFRFIKFTNVYVTDYPPCGLVCCMLDVWTNQSQVKDVNMWRSCWWWSLSVWSVNVMESVTALNQLTSYFSHSLSSSHSRSAEQRLLGAARGLQAPINGKKMIV